MKIEIKNRQRKQNNGQRGKRQTEQVWGDCSQEKRFQEGKGQSCYCHWSSSCYCSIMLLSVEVLTDESKSCLTNTNTLQCALFPRKEGQHIPENDIELNSPLCMCGEGAGVCASCIQQHSANICWEPTLCSRCLTLCWTQDIFWDSLGSMNGSGVWKGLLEVFEQNPVGFVCVPVLRTRPSTREEQRKLTQPPASLWD
jgi:hypothetical protein